MMAHRSRSGRLWEHLDSGKKDLGGRSNRLAKIPAPSALDSLVMRPEPCVPDPRVTRTFVLPQRRKRKGDLQLLTSARSIKFSPS